MCKTKSYFYLDCFNKLIKLQYLFFNFDTVGPMHQCPKQKIDQFSGTSVTLNVLRFFFKK